MNEGDIVLVPLPQVDGQLKNRPALVLRKMPPYQDLLFCGISTQLRQEVKGFDDIINSSDSDFSVSGLRTTSLIRLGFLAVLPVKDVVGTLGSVDSSRHQRLLKRLADYLTDDAA
jgi:mRNA interferase MazF